MVTVCFRSLSISIAALAGVEIGGVCSGFALVSASFSESRWLLSLLIVLPIVIVLHFQVELYFSISTVPIQLLINQIFLNRLTQFSSTKLDTCNRAIQATKVRVSPSGDQQISVIELSTISRHTTIGRELHVDQIASVRS